MRVLIVGTWLALTSCAPVYVVGSDVPTKQEIEGVLSRIDQRFLQHEALQVEILKTLKDAGILKEEKK